MKHLLLTTIAAVVLVGCGPPKPPDISIWEATAKGNIEAVKQHLVAGTDVNTKNRMGWTPLHNAAVSGEKKTVELLISSRADVNAKDDRGGTPLDVAIQYKQSETADLLRKHGGKSGGKSGAEYSIHVAARMGNIEAAKQHLAAGKDINAKDHSGSTPLYWAASAGHKETVELLMAKGADVNAIKKANVGLGDTPLDSAIRWDNPETADLLRKHGGKTGAELKAEGK